PDVRHYDDADVARLVRRGRERGEAVSVGGLEHEVTVGDGGSRDRRNRRRRVEVEAHGPDLNYRPSTRRSRSWSLVHQPTDARARAGGERAIRIVLPPREVARSRDAQAFGVGDDQRTRGIGTGKPLLPRNRQEVEPLRAHRDGPDRLGAVDEDRKARSLP